MRSRELTYWSRVNDLLATPARPWTKLNWLQDVLRNNNQLRNADVELQQRALEYSQLSSITSQDVLATVLEEMPPFPERESSILAKLKKKKPAAAQVWFETVAAL